MQQNGNLNPLERAAAIAKAAAQASKLLGKLPDPDARADAARIVSDHYRAEKAAR